MQNMNVTPDGAQDQINKMLNSGQISQEQLDQYINQAKQMMKMFGIK